MAFGTIVFESKTLSLAHWRRQQLDGNVSAEFRIFKSRDLDTDRGGWDVVSEHLPQRRVHDPVVLHAAAPTGRAVICRRGSDPCPRFDPGSGGGQGRPTGCVRHHRRRGRRAHDQYRRGWPLRCQRGSGGPTPPRGEPCRLHRRGRGPCDGGRERDRGGAFSARPVADPGQRDRGHGQGIAPQGDTCRRRGAGPHGDQGAAPLRRRPLPRDSCSSRHLGRRHLRPVLGSRRPLRRDPRDARRPGADGALPPQGLRERVQHPRSGDDRRGGAHARRVHRRVRRSHDRGARHGHQVPGHHALRCRNQPDHRVAERGRCIRRWQGHLACLGPARVPGLHTQGRG